MIGIVYGAHEILASRFRNLLFCTFELAKIATITISNYLREAIMPKTKKLDFTHKTSLKTLVIFSGYLAVHIHETLTMTNELPLGKFIAGTQSVALYDAMKK